MNGEGLRVGGLALLGLTVLLLLRQQKGEWAPFLRMAVGVLALGGVVTMAGGVLESLQRITEDAGESVGVTVTLLGKGLAVALLTEGAAALCRDSGEGGLATWVELAGKLELLLLALPLMGEVWDFVEALL